MHVKGLVLGLVLSKHSISGYCEWYNYSHCCYSYYIILMLLNSLTVILDPSPLVPMLLCTDARCGWRSLGNGAWDWGTCGPSSGVILESSGQGRKDSLSGLNLKGKKGRGEEQMYLLFLGCKENVLYCTRTRLLQIPGGFSKNGGLAIEAVIVPVRSLPSHMQP